MKKILEFFKNHRIIANLCYIIVASMLILWATMIWLDVWTDHGETCQVPDVKNMTFEEASRELSKVSLIAVLSDSIFANDSKSGMVVDQVPNAGSIVKPNKSVYLVINAFARKCVSMPNFEGMPIRQARSVLKGLGFTEIREVEVAHEYKGEVVSVRYNGLPISTDMKIPITASLTIEVGKGVDDNLMDSIDSFVEITE